MDDPLVAELANTSLASAEGRGALDALTHLIGDERRKVGERAAIALVRRITPSWSGTGFEDAVEALGSSGHPDALPALLAVLEMTRTDRYDPLYWSALDALGKLGVGAAIPALLREFDECSHPAAALSLARLGARSHIAGMMAMLDGTSLFPRSMVVAALELLGAHESTPSLRKHLVWRAPTATARDDEHLPRLTARALTR